jgi:hypothetical protein
MPGHQIPLNSGIRYPSVGSVENTFLSGMQSSESSFIVTSTGSSTEDGSESHESPILRIGGSFNGKFGFRDVSFGLSFLFPHHLGDNPARAKILDRTPCRNCQQLDRLCHRIANVTAWLYSREPVLHRRIRVQHAVVAQGTNTRRSRSGAATEIAGRIYPSWCASKRAAIVTLQIINSEVNICN